MLCKVDGGGDVKSKVFTEASGRFFEKKLRKKLLTVFRRGTFQAPV